ncbi:guanylate-binding protein 1-like [Monodelphis domestica]|uniref:Guanylate-binding protein 1-like n=1 Tax=Monodelphis domestica TaxID=13616 RepID=F6XE08_MONDO|nr:guanylate-binding protein 1-like [Monodelphis domestica]XP_016285324.1 guanylate-binding protein 1-like [Monodelphis domestica]
MASSLSMPAPVCLIENSKGQFVVKQEALDILDTVTQPVVVVAIVGLYRTGKSYLMNRLAGQKTGFSLGSTVQSHTKGIWMWCVPHPKKPNHTLILLDTEGLGDVEKGDNTNDTWIFVLALLLSSTFVYNSMGTINQQAMDELYYVTELTDKIKEKSSSSTEQISLFPDFVWTVRDFILDLEINGEPITSDQYLENALKLKKGTSEEVKICIKKFFLKRKCFIFVPPAHTKMLKKLEKLHDDELDGDFVESTKNFCEYIFKNSEAKTLPGGGMVHGPRLGNLILTYVQAITSGGVPCMENAVLALSQTENSAAVQRAYTYYEEIMRQSVNFPTETHEELLNVHNVCKMEAIKVFMKNSFKDVDQKFQKTLEIRLEDKLHDFCEQNERESLDRCTALLLDIFSPLEEAVKQKVFSFPGGYDTFLDNMQNLVEEYNRQPRKGIQAKKTLEEYLKSKETVTEAIKQADQALTAKKREKEEQEKKVQAAAAAAREQQMRLKRQEEMMREQEKRQQEQIRQLAEEMEAQRRKYLEEQEREQARRLQEQEKLLQEQQRREIAERQREIQALREQIHNNNSQSDCIIL